MQVGLRRKCGRNKNQEDFRLESNIEAQSNAQLDREDFCASIYSQVRQEAAKMITDY